MFSSVVKVPSHLLLASICFLSLACGPVMVVSDEMRLYDVCQAGGVCSDTDGSSNAFMHPKSLLS